MKLSEIHGEQALSVMADLIDPLVQIFKDDEVQKAAKGKLYTDFAKSILKRKPKEVIKVMAILDLQNPETYEVNLATLPTKIMEIVNDKELHSLFSSAAQMAVKSASGSASENTAG